MGGMGGGGGVGGGMAAPAAAPSGQEMLTPNKREVVRLTAELVERLVLVKGKG